MRRNIGAQLWVIAGLTLAGVGPVGRVHAFSDPARYSETTETGGSAGRHFTGSPLDGYGCNACHQGGTAIPVTVNGLPTDGYQPGATYEVSIRLDSLSRALEPHAALLLEFADEQRRPAGVIAAPDVPADPTIEFAITDPDFATFEAQVMPILARDCSFHACHGARQRFFQLVGPGRPRLSPLTRDADPITPEELRFNYERARSMIDRDEPARSALFLKPLEPVAGGAGHEGTDLFGRNVYQDKLDPSFLVLQNWVMSAPPPVPLAEAARAPIANRTGGP